MSVKFTTIPPKILSQAITSASTAFKPSDILGWDGMALDASSFGTVAYGAFISADRTVLELFSWDPSTIGSASLNFVTRGLSFKGDITNIPTNQLDWPSGTTTIQLGSDVSQLFSTLGVLGNPNTWTALNIFSGYAPQTDTDPTNPNDLTRLSYVQALVLGTLTTIDVIVPGTAGATIAAGNLLYFDDPSNQWKLANASSSSTVDNVLLGVAQGAGTSGNPITNGVLLQGEDTHQTGLTDGQTQYASNTPGAIATSAGTVSVVVGISKGTTGLYFAPRFNSQITTNQLNALAGNNTDIAVGSGNKFVTQTGLQHSAEKYAVDNSASSTAYTVALSPIPTSLTDGMVVYAKLVNANTTTAPTLNVNSLGAKTIKKLNNVALAVGDIGTNQLCTFIYDLTNTVWTLQNPVINATAPTSATGLDTSRAGNAASGSQTIAHGLGRVPKMVRITCAYSAGLMRNNFAASMSWGAYDGTHTTNTSIGGSQAAGYGGSIGADTTNIIAMYIYNSFGGGSQLATVAVDATNINLTWTHSNNSGNTDFSTNVFNIMWEVF